MANSSEPNKVEMIITAGAVAFCAGAGIVLAIGGGIWYLVEQAQRGNQGAASFLLVLGIVFVIVLSFVLFSSVMWVNQKQDERAMAANMKLMQTNALENMALIEQTQKAMLLQSRTSGQNVQNDIRTLQFLNQLGQLQSGQAQPESFLVTNDSLYHNLIEGEKND